MTIEPWTQFRVWPSAPGRRVHEQVVAAIRDEIVAGRLKAGDKLPSERHLSEMLGVSRTSVREAIRILESQSVIRARVGAGPDSGSVVVSEEGDLLSNLLKMHTALESLSLSEIVDVRCLLEMHAVRSTATRITTEPQALRPVELALGRMRNATDHRAAFVVADADFHLAIADLSGNRLLSFFMRALREVLEQTLDVIYADVEDWENVSRTVCSEHAAILDAIRAGDGDSGAELVMRHIRRAYDRRFVDGDALCADTFRGLNTTASPRE